MDGKVTRFAFGFALAILLAGTAAEAFLRWAPPDDLHPYLGDASPIVGHLSRGGDFNVRYKTFDDLVADNPETLGPGAVLWQSSNKTIHLFIGSSFGFNLCGRQRARRTDVASLHLDRREHPQVRMAQIEALARGGVRVDRVFLVLIPVDFTAIGEFGLDACTTAGDGGVGYEPRRPPGVLAPLIDSRLGMAAWVRSGWHRQYPSFRRSQFATRVPENVKNDVDRMFAGLARVERETGFPITIVLVPQKPMVMAGTRFALDDVIESTAQKAGVDIVYPRDEFLAHPNRADLYIPDGHLSAAGDDLVLDTIEKRGRR